MNSVIVTDIPVAGYNRNPGVLVTPIAPVVRIRYKIRGAYSHWSGEEGFVLDMPRPITVFDGLVIEADGGFGFEQVYPAK